MDVVDVAALDLWVLGPEIPKARTDLFAFVLNEPERGLQGEHIAATGSGAWSGVPSARRLACGMRRVSQPPPFSRRMAARRWR
jgi:hypothetical protein